MKKALPQLGQGILVVIGYPTLTLGLTSVLVLVLVFKSHSNI